MRNSDRLHLPRQLWMMVALALGWLEQTLLTLLTLCEANLFQPLEIASHARSACCRWRC